MSTLSRYVGWEQGTVGEATPQRTLPRKFVIKILFGIHQRTGVLKHGDPTPLKRIQQIWPARYDMIYLLTATGLTPGGSNTVHIYTQTVHRTTQNKQYIEEHNNLWECGPCPVLARFTLAFALQLRKKHGKTSVRVAASKNT